MTEKLQYRLKNTPEVFPARSEMFRVYVGERECGDLVYFWEEEYGHWEIEGIVVLEDMQGKGIGKALIDAFSKRVGPDQPVHCIVSHEKSVEVVSRKYKVSGASGFYFLPENEISDVPLVGILRSGYVHTERIQISSNPFDTEDTPYDIELWARTAKTP